MAGKGLADLLKPKESKYVLEGKNLKIGRGIMVFGDNEIIPLDAISFVETLEKGKKGYEKWPQILAVGMIMACIPVMPIRVAGIIAMIGAIANIILIFQQNRQTVFYLRIQNHAGRFYYIEDTKLDFIKEIRKAIMACLADKNGSYDREERLLNAFDDTFKGDQIMNIGTINITGGNGISIGGGDAVGGNKYTAGRDFIQEISDEEWKGLEKFALEREKDFSEGDRHHTVCKAMAVCAKSKNHEKCKRLLEAAGEKTLDLIFASAPMAIKAIINKLM